MMPASSLCSQSCTSMPLLLQLSSLCSFPLHTTSSRIILPLPPPKLERNDTSKSKENRTNTLGGGQNEVWCTAVVGIAYLKLGVPVACTLRLLLRYSSHRRTLYPIPPGCRTPPVHFCCKIRLPNVHLRHRRRTILYTDKQDGLRARWRRRATIYYFRKKSWYSDLTRGLVE